jgi:hypothetical protein
MCRRPKVFLAAVVLFALPLVAADRIIQFNDDGGWCWFEDERVIVSHGKLIVGTVAAGIRDPARRGDIEVVSYGLDSGARQRFTLHHVDDPTAKKRWFDDHNSPAFLVRPDGRILTMFSLHGPDEKIYYRVSANPHDTTAWRDERVFAPSAASRVTYSNLHYLSAEKRIYDFFRGFNNSFKPSYAYSEDSGDSWTAGNVFIDVPLKFRHRPYVKYASNGVDTVHIVYTDGHPRDFDNSIYHVFYRDGKLHRSDGTVIRSLSEGLKSPEEGTRVFQGDPNNVGWVSDVHIDAKGNPYLAFSVQKDSAGLPNGKAGEDHRYHYARWRGGKWLDNEVAYGGHRIYAGEDDYTGLPCLDPNDPNVMYISTNADPVSGKPLISNADNQRHWEIFRGTTKDGLKWTWTPVTKNSGADNLRPAVPIWPGKQYALLWLRGKMQTYTNFEFEVVGVIGDR